MKDPNCIFCKIAAHEVPSHIVYEDELTIAFLDIAAVSKGHTLVVPKIHAENLSGNTKEEAEALMDVVWKIAPAIMKALGASGYNLGMNHGKDAGQEVAHTHFHIMPRYAGVERSFRRLSPADFELDEVATQIKAAIEIV
ncbi:MAG: HIT family protein [Patescibacteria group bacterium]